MIIVSAKIKTAPGRRGEFIEAAKPVIAATRAEAGCVEYGLYASTEDADGLMYFEQWASREALDAHTKSPHLAEFRKMREERGLTVGQGDLRVFDAK